MEFNENTYKGSYLVLFVCIAFIVSCIILNISIFYGFLGSIILTVLVLMNRGKHLRDVKNTIMPGLYECRALYLFILLIGATVSIWLSSGVVPTLMYYSFQYMKGLNFLLSSFVITAVLSIFTGTAVGTLSTIGVVFLGVGQGFGIPEHIILGVIISGAFIADKISPLSGLLNLTLSTTQKKYKEVIGSMLITMIPTFLITSIVYIIIGSSYTANGDNGQLEYYRHSIEKGFNISPFLLVVPLIIVVLCLFGVKTIKTMSLGLGAGMIISLTLQKMSLSQVVKSIVVGYRASTPSLELNSILVSGGAISMVEVVLIVMGAIALSSLFEELGLTTSLIKRSISKVKTKEQLIITTGLISSILTIVTCDQTVGIVLPGKTLRDKYDDMKVDRSILARTISDTGTIIAPLMPWNVNAIIIGMISGISAISYGPYAVLCYIAPMVTIGAAFISKYSEKRLKINCKKSIVNKDI